jgi:hypothetical protein
VIVAQRPFRVGPDFAAFGRRVLGLLADDTIETDYQFVVRVKQAANDLGIDLEKPRG